MTDECPLTNWRVAVPESRQLDVLTDMLEVRGAAVTRCPLVSIHDSSDDAAINDWLKEFCENHYDDFVILTGEGIRRLTAFAERFEMIEQWKSSLQKVRKIARGPKPGAALRPLNTKPDILAVAPTTDGVIETLNPMDLTGRKIAVQLYGEEPNLKLQNFLVEKGASIRTVAPYIYASDMETERVEELIYKLIKGDLDILVLTSVVQIKRLRSVAKNANLEDRLIQALKKIPIASVGPIITEMLADMGIAVTITPQEKFFMKPLVREMVKFVEMNPN